MCCNGNISLVTAVGHGLYRIDFPIISLPTTELQQDWPIVPTVYELPCMWYSEGGVSEVVKIVAREAATNAVDLQMKKLRVHLFNEKPAVPLAGVALPVDLGKRVATIMVSSGSAVSNTGTGYRRVMANVREAFERPAEEVRSGGAGKGTAGSAIIVADETVTYPGNTLAVSMWVRYHY